MNRLPIKYSPFIGNTADMGMPVLGPFFDNAVPMIVQRVFNRFKRKIANFYKAGVSFANLFDGFAIRTFDFGWIPVL